MVFDVLSTSESLDPGKDEASQFILFFHRLFGESTDQFCTRWKPRKELVRIFFLASGLEISISGFKWTG